MIEMLTHNIMNALLYSYSGAKANSFQLRTSLAHPNMLKTNLNCWHLRPEALFIYILAITDNRDG